MIKREREALADKDFRYGTETCLPRKLAAESVKAKRAGGEPALVLLLRERSLAERRDAYRRAVVGGTIPFIRK